MMTSRMSAACAVTTLFIAACLSVAAFAQQSNGSTKARHEIAFDIPAQPLAAALSSYGAVSGTQVLYESALVIDKGSAAIKGMLTPEAALQALLTGTGLIGRRTDIDAMTIVPEPREHSAKTALIAPDMRFLGSLQAGILNVLCRNSDTRPGQYRMGLQLWVAPNGVLQRAALLSSTGDARRDEALVALLQNVRIAVPPPPGMNQPITLTIVPRSPLQSPECSD